MLKRLPSTQTNAAYYVLGSISSSVIAAIAGIVMARYLGVSEYGRYATATSFLGVLGVFSNLGINQILIRDVARDTSLLHKRGDQAFTHVIVLSFTMWLFSGILAAFFYDDLQTISFIVVYGLYAIVLSNVIALYFLSLFQVRSHLATFAAVQTAAQGATLVLIAFALWLSMPLMAIAVINIVVAIFSVVLLYWVSVPRRLPRFDSSEAVRLIRESLPFGVSNMLTVVYMQIGVVILSYFGDVTEVGHFSVSYRLITMTYLLPTALYSVVLPRAFELGKSDLPSLQIFIKKFFRILALIGLPLSVHLFVYADNIITVLFGKAYAASIPILKSLSLLTLLKFISFPAALTLTSRDRQPLRTTIQASVAVVSIVLSLILVKSQGMNGLAVSMILCDVLLSLLYIFWSYREGLRPADLTSFIYGSLAAALMGGTSLVLMTFMPFWLSGIFSSLVYLAILAVLYRFGPREGDQTIGLSFLKWGGEGD